MTKIDAYLTFDGNCAEAMTFYKECLDAELNIMKISDSPAAAHSPAHVQDHVMHASLMKGNLSLLGSDMKPNSYTKGNSISLCVNCSSEEEINSFFNNLAVGGKINDPLQEQFWGATFGQLTDKYGVNWMFNYDKNQNK